MIDSAEEPAWVSEGLREPPRPSIVADARDGAWDDHLAAIAELGALEDERPGGQTYADIWSEAERAGDRAWRLATEQERIAYVINAGVARRRRAESGMDAGEGRVGPTRPELRAASSIAPPAHVDDALIEDLIRPGSLVVLAAAEGLGKTRMAVEIQIRAATGTGAVFGRYAVPRPIRVALVDEENGEAQLWREEEAVLAALGIARAELEQLYRVSFAGLHLARRDRQAWLRAELEAKRPDLVIIDTGGAVVDDEWGAALKDGIRFLRELMRELGCAFLVLVHLTKPGRDRASQGADRLHGSSLADVMGQWSRHADVVMTCTDLGADRVRLSVRKRIAPSTVILARADGLWTYVADADAPAARERIDDRIIRAIAAGAERVDDLVEALGVARRTVYLALRRLRLAGFVDDGTPLRLTDDGLEATE